MKQQVHRVQTGSINLYNNLIFIMTFIKVNLFFTKVAGVELLIKVTALEVTIFLNWSFLTGRSLGPITCEKFEPHLLQHFIYYPYYIYTLSNTFRG